MKSIETSAEKLFSTFETYKANSLKIRRFKQKDLFELIKKLPFEKMVIGQSFEGREIIKLRLGDGPIPILLWSQMHGNEAAATMALADIFNFFNSKNDGFDDFKKQILDKCTLHFIPMLNPDGAERFERRTAQGIDMNRDAVALQCPESQILKNQVMNLNPVFSFNLHDQGIRYNTENSGTQATISFLATAYNEAREWNENRIRSRQVISLMNTVLQKYIPAGIGRYSDEFEPRAFGDNIQKWGSSLILIESGGHPNDPEKQFIRKLNYVAILTALESIAAKNYTYFTLEDYENIPKNQKDLFDIKIINAKISRNGKTYTMALGINLEEKNNANATSFTRSSVIEDMGDLSVFYGLKTIDANGAEIQNIAAHSDLIRKHQIKNIDLVNIAVDSRASFVLVSKNARTLILNGKILD
jgi:Zinc carboxypeptidase